MQNPIMLMFDWMARIYITIMFLIMAAIMLPFIAISFILDACSRRGRNYWE